MTRKQRLRLRRRQEARLRTFNQQLVRAQIAKIDRLIMTPPTFGFFSTDRYLVMGAGYNSVGQWGAHLLSAEPLL